MKKIVVILLLLVGSISVKAQFPTTDSLRSFVNRYIRNSAVEAFQNLRLNTALIGMSRFLDSAYGGQVTSFTSLNDSTARLITLGGDTMDVVIRGTPARFGLEDATTSANRSFNFNNFTFEADSFSNYNLFSKVQSAGVDRGVIGQFRSSPTSSYLWHYHSNGVSTRSYGFNAYPQLTQMFAAGHVPGHATYVQSDTLQVILEADPNRLYMFHDSVSLHNINGGNMDFRIRTLPETIDTTQWKPLAIGPLGQLKKVPGWPGSGGGGVTDGDKGDITVSGSGTAWAINNGYLPLTLSAAKTINQTGNNIVFGGGGKVRSDSLSLKKTFTPFMTGDTAIGSGHSIMAGQSATVSDSTLLTRVGRSHSMFVRNLGVPSSLIWSAVKIQMSWINAGHNAYELYMPALNDVRTTNILSAGNRKTINAIINGMKAMWMNHMAKASVGAGDGSITRSGSWNSSWDASIEAGKKTNAGYTSSAGAYAEYTFSDSTVGVQFMGNNSGGATVVTISIDGSTVETFDLNNQNDGVGGSYMPTAKFYTGLTNAAHTIRVTNTSGDGLMIVDYFTNLRDAASAPPVCFFHEPHLDATGYSGGQASDAAIDTINVKYDSLRNALPAPWKARTIVARTNTRYIATTSSGLSGDHVHPNDLGHGQIALAEYDAVASVIGADSGTVQYGTDGYLYVDAKKVPYANTLGLGDVINNNPVLTTPADIRGTTFEFNGFSRLGFNFFKITASDNMALAHGSLGVQGPLGGIFVGSRDGDTTKGYIYYSNSAGTNIYDTWNSRSQVRLDTSLRTAFYNNTVTSSFSVPLATVHIGGNTNAVAGHTPFKIGKSLWVSTPEPYAWEPDSLYIGWTDGAGNRDTLATRGWARSQFGGGATVLKGTTNWTPGVVAAGSSASTTVTVTGAATTDVVHVNKVTGGISNGEIYDAYVSAANTVTIRVHNVSTGSANYSSSETYNVVVFKY